MSETLDDILSLKLTGGQPEFRDPVAVLWGQKEEDHNRELFTKYSGVATTGCHAMLGHERWPYLATTLDGFIWRPIQWSSVEHPEMFDKPEQVNDAIGALEPGQQYILEMKQTSEYGIGSWMRGYTKEPVDRSKKSKVILGKFRPTPPTMPVYYLSQIHTQMAIAGFERAIAVVKGGASHMTAHAHDLLPIWPTILDNLNKRVEGPILELRKQLDEREDRND